MKTVFKVGMKVYDQIVFPNKKGIITEIGKGTVCPLIVKVENFYLYYKLNGAFGAGVIPTLSIKPYEIEFQGFEQKASVPTYKEAVEWLEKNSKDRVIYADEAYINEEYERAFEALKKLTILRDYYNEGWQSDWEDEEEKFSIQVCEGEFHTFESIECQRVVSFKTEEIRDKFLEDQRELLEIAKPLL
ncbi:hypothetical protein [Capnocytophaga sp. oral taxon 338]|uniref:hypothetical protein n=1 Tax=Capnocytophaga sp. oral taxon 338 TaxID=710239 RepID=UPI000202D1AB|nr:hypothetical protein [Capnocytophaga sp. oral taxon 338]EGD33310.1 hypothetical protein HMPREF9071_2104 [Capnocytophaga sp. oral taxon 338 str. F0234]